MEVHLGSIKRIYVNKILMTKYIWWSDAIILCLKSYISRQDFFFLLLQYCIIKIHQRKCVLEWFELPQGRNSKRGSICLIMLFRDRKIPKPALVEDSQCRLIPALFFIDTVFCFSYKNSLYICICHLTFITKLRREGKNGYFHFLGPDKSSNTYPH